MAIGPHSRGIASLSLAQLLAGVGMVLVPSHVAALEELKGEKKALSACELNLCRTLVSREPKGSDLRCTLTKTWERSTIKEADSTSVSWGFGDARCTVKIDVKRTEIVNAITAEKTKFHLPDQKIDCIVEESAEGREARHVVVVVSPKIEMKNGKAEKIWVNLKSVEGSTAVAGTLKVAAFLADKVGLFHGAMLKGVNGFIHNGCPKVLARADADAKEKKARTAKKALQSDKPAGETAKPATGAAVAAEPPKPAAEARSTEEPAAAKAADPPPAEAPPQPPKTE